MKRQMKGKIVLFASMAAIGFSAGAHAATYNFTIINPPGAGSSEAWGIDGGNVVGRYDIWPTVHGYSYDGTAFTTIDVPGASSTQAYGIDGKNIVGDYDLHGFLYNGTTFTTIDVPGAYRTYATDIDGGNIVGWYDSSGVRRSFLYDGSTFTTISVPGAYWTYAWGIDGENIVGWYREDGVNDRHHGFLYNMTTSTFTDFKVPGAWNTEAYGILGDKIVGMYVDPTWGKIHGFVYDGKTFTDISVPGYAAPYVYDIDAAGNIVGKCRDGGDNYRGFIGSPNPVPIPGALLLLGSGLAALVARRRAKGL